MEIKILQVFLGADGLPYKDQERTVHFPIVGSGFQGASNTTKIRFYYDELVEQDDTETAWVACAKLPNGKIGSKVLETDYDSTLGEHYALLELDSFYFQYKGDVYISLQGYQGGVQVSYDEETELYTIYGTPTIAATGSIKLSVNYATQFVGSGETSNVNFQRILADLGTKLGIRAQSEHVEELPSVGQNDIFYVVNDDPNNPNLQNIYVWNENTQSYVWVGDNTLDLGDYYTKEQGVAFETNIDNRVDDVENRVDDVENELESVAAGAPSGVYATVSDLTTAHPTGDNKIYVVLADGKWYYWNGSAWTAGGVYLSTGNAVPDTRTVAEMPLSSDIAVKPLSERIDLIATKTAATKQIKVPCINSGYIKTDGTVAANTDWAYSELIDIDLLEKHVYTFFVATVATFAFYNSSKEFIGYYTQSPVGYMASAFIVPPANTKYFRFTCHVADDYDVYVLEPIVTEKDFELVKKFTEKQVLVDYPTVGYYINTSGVLTANADWSVSDYIDADAFVKEVYTFFLSTVATFAFYDSNKQFIGYYTLPGSSGNYMKHTIVNPPDNCKYIRVTCHNAEKSEIEVYYIAQKVQIDETLTKQGFAADAEKTGEIKESVVSAVYAGFANANYSDAKSETKLDITITNTNVDPNTNGYTNGLLIKNSSKIIGFQLLGTITTTTFNIFVTDSEFNILKAIYNYSPDEIVDGKFYLDEPMSFNKDTYLFLSFTNGKWELQNVGSNTLKEIRSGTTVADSPIKAPFDVIYNEIETVTFKNDYAELLPKTKISDFYMPKVVDTDGDYCLVGRWFEQNGKMCANEDGSSIMFKIRGTTSLTIDFSTLSQTNYTPYFAYSIDGSSFTRQLITNQTITLPDTEEHFVWIVVDGMGENDPTARGKWYGTIGFKLNSITAGSGGTLINVKPKAKKIMFFGDSIVEGINVLGVGANADTNSATNGFAFRTARKLNCIPLMAGYGASGILLNGSFAKTIDVLKYNKENTLVNNMEPDIVFIESGVNDYSAINQQGSTYTVEQFKNGYKALLKAIGIKYPGIPVCCMIPFAQRLIDEIKECAAEYSYAYVIETSDFTVSTSDGGHPDVAGATNAALHLSQKLIDLFGLTYFLNV